MPSRALVTADTIAQARTTLATYLAPGRTVYTILDHVSHSGLLRHIRVMIIEDNQPVDITWAVAAVLNKPRAPQGGIKIGGVGMDMGFALVYDLSRRLWPEGFTVPAGQMGRNGDTTGYGHDGGYALNHKWL